MLTIDKKYKNSLDPLTQVENLLSFTYFRGDLFMAVSKNRYSLYDFILDITKSTESNNLSRKVLAQIIKNLSTTMRRLAHIGIWFPMRKYIDPRNIGLDFSHEYQWKLIR